MKFYNSLQLAIILFFANSTSWSQTDCNGYNPDVDDDNAITITDLLALLGLFEEVDADNDGVWDSVDNCIGALDVCGVCNGPGPTVVVGDSLVCPIYGCTDNLASNFSASANTDDGTCTYGPAQCGGQSTITFDGHTYNLVGIGNQCWFKENLRSDNYRNGDPIPGNLSDAAWKTTYLGAQSYYNYQISNLQIYGRLYNYFAFIDPRGVCPIGFRVPSEADWMELEMNLGMDSAVVQINGDFRGTNQGLMLKSTPTDEIPWDGENDSGFSAVAGGFRTYTGSFSSAGPPSGTAHFYSFDPINPNNPWKRALFTSYFHLNQWYYHGIYRGGENERTGLSIRCILE
jgi:uncharacterized protein (TIGR02145 family)